MLVKKTIASRTITGWLETRAPGMKISLAVVARVIARISDNMQTMTAPGPE
jgi:hypothetical protein